MDGSASAAIVAAGVAALVAMAAAPALLRRAAGRLRVRAARAQGRLLPFAGAARVIDGETIEVARVRVRLFGIETPGTGRPGGRAAREHLIRLVGGAPVEVAPVAVDRLGRTVARVRRDGADLAQAMARDGYARAMLCRSWAYLGAELGARRSRRGLWSAGRSGGAGDPAEPARNRRSP